jgi:RHS repeat-associated protein
MCLFCKFTGKERDTESGLDNFDARYFGSSLARFVSPDPGQESGIDNLDDPQMWNGTRMLETIL